LVVSWIALYDNRLLPESAEADYVELAAMGDGGIRAAVAAGFQTDNVRCHIARMLIQWKSNTYCRRET
jgi:hypothetical protein